LISAGSRIAIAHVLTARLDAIASSMCKIASGKWKLRATSGRGLDAEKEAGAHDGPRLGQSGGT
jgi:hypothetical protein